MLTPNRNPILFPAPPPNKNVALPAAQKERRLRRAAKRRVFKAHLKSENAAKLIEKLPKPGETLHLICNGTFGLWDVVPAVLKMTGATILRADIATLSMSSANVSQMGALLDQGKISDLWLLYSCMFRDKSPEETNHLTVTMQGRRAHIAAVRCHAKILALELSTGDCLTIESSANLRSCGNLEQYMVANDRQLLHFHRGWIEDAIKDVEKTGAKK